MADFQQVLQRFRDCGARDGAYLPQTKVVMSKEFRDICKSNGCSKYGKCYMCPPDIGDIQDLMGQVRQFEHALLYQSVTAIEDSFDFDGMMEAGHLHAMLSQRIHAVLKDCASGPFLHLSGGGCHLCERCAKEDALPCRFPDKALSSLEGYGIDVCNTARAANMKYINGQNTVTYFGIVLFSDGAFSQ